MRRPQRFGATPAARVQRTARFYGIAGVSLIADGLAAILGALWRGYVRLFNAGLRLGGWWDISNQAGVLSLIRTWGGEMLDYGGFVYNVKHPAFGAIWNGVVDDTDAIRAALARVESHGGRVVLPAGTGLVTEEIVVDFGRANIQGAGENQTFIQFEPTEDGLACFSFLPGDAGPLFQCSLMDLTIYSEDTTWQKTAVRVTDASEFLMHRVQVGGGVDFTGGEYDGSIGLHYKGRELLSVRNCSIEADRPIVFSVNPNSFLDNDHTRIAELILISTGMTYPCIQFEDEVFISNFMGEDLSLNLGLHGVEVGAFGSLSSQVFTLKRIRWEQGTGGANSYIVKIDTTNMQNVRLEQITGGTTTAHSGYYLRGIDRCTLDHCDYTGTGKALDVDGTVQGLVLTSTFFLPTSTVSLGTLIPSLTITDGGESGTEPAKRITYYVDSASGGYIGHGAAALRVGEIGVEPGAPPSNTAVFYVRDNGAGKTQYVVRFPTGAVQVIATEP